MSPPRVLAYLGLGSNLDDPLRQVRDALTEVADLPESRLLRRSSLYQTPPLGPPGQPDYVNAVAAVETALPPLALLDALQAIEARHGRVRGEHWGPRTLDLDLLLYGTQTIASPRLRVPHPQMHRRAFVLVPLAEIAPDLEVPGLGPLGSLLGGVSDQGMRRLDGGDRG